MNKDLDILAVGDASIDAFLTPTESETLCQLNDKDEIICFSYGDKIPVKNLEFSIGGNAANNSIGTKRLGLESAALLTIGDDETGDLILEKLIKEGVDVGYVERQEKTPSNYSVGITYAGERTLFTYKSDVKYKIAKDFPDCSWVYLTSMGDDFEEIYRKVVDWVKNKPDIKMAFNPGSRQIRAGVDKLKNAIQASYIVYVNRKEAEILTGFEGSVGKEKDLLKAMSSMGPKIPIVTDGSNGSFVYDGTKFLKCGILPVDSYERTGAGDAFGSGCISALAKGKSLDEAMLWGTVNSASVIGYAGAQKGLLREEDMILWMDRARSSNLKVEEF